MGLIPAHQALESEIFNPLGDAAYALDLLALRGAIKDVGKIISAARRVDVPSRRNFLSSEDFADLPRTGTIDPKTIRFSQDSINYKFSKPFENQTIDDFVKALRSGDVDPTTIKPIRIVEREGKIFTLDNRRLHAFQEAGVDIPFQKLDNIPRRERFKFTSENDGASIIIRGENK